MRDDLPNPSSHSFISQRLRLHYVDWGNPDAPPLLLVHGGRDHCRNWDWVASALRDDYHIIAPDLRGHGDSQWSRDGNYGMAPFVYDLAQLIYQQKLAPVSIISHSLGANIALRYAGIYPETVKRLVAIEGLGDVPSVLAEKARKPVDQRMREWVDSLHQLSARTPRRYASIDEALVRMQEENSHLSPAQARHLTIHGLMQNEDGSYSWKFDNYIRSFAPADIRTDELHHLWARITCPTLLVYGRESWASNPAEDGRAAHFKNARVDLYDNAGHWVHHDQLDRFIGSMREFLAD
ncbi:MAG: alpha/beta fold hydrolase [Sphingomonadaceae bacterium]